MIEQNIEAFEAFAADLSQREAKVRAALPPRSREQVLGVGRLVAMLDFGVGVFVRGSILTPLSPVSPRTHVVMDFVVGNSTVPEAKATYYSYPDRVTVNHRPEDMRGQLSVVSLAKVLTGVDLLREVRDELTRSSLASQDELDFVKEFTDDPGNSWATFHFTGRPGHTATGIEVTMLE
jgi:hypothetical protein